MRLRISLMVLMAVVTGGMAGPALAQDPLANGDFSSGLDDWDAYQVGNVTITGGYALFQEPAAGSLSQMEKGVRMIFPVHQAQIRAEIGQRITMEGRRMGQGREMNDQ